MSHWGTKPFMILQNHFQSGIIHDRPSSENIGEKNASQKQRQFREERTLDQNLVRSVRWPTSCCWLAVGDDFGISCPHTNNKESQRRVGWVGWRPQEPWHRWHPTHRTQQMRTASNCLRRAYAICTKQVEAGSVAGAVKNWVVNGWDERSWGQCEVCMPEIPVIWKNLNSPRKIEKTLGPLYIILHPIPRIPRIPALGPGRLARAMVTLQLCALSSKAGRHAEALEEALVTALQRKRGGQMWPRPRLKELFLVS